MERNGFLVRLHRKHKLVPVDQFRDQLGMVDDFIISAKGRIFIFYGVETVRAGGHDPFRMHRVQLLHVVLRQHKENILPPGPAGRVAGTLLIFTQNGKIDLGRDQDLCKSARGLLGARINSRSASDPPKNFGAGVLDNGWHGQPLGPFHPFGYRDTPRILHSFHAAKSRFKLFGETILHQAQVAADVQDVPHGFISHRADIDTGTAGGTRPDSFLGDDGFHQLICGEGIFYAIEEIAFIYLQGRGGEHLSRLVRRAHFLTAEAHDAAVRIHQLLPAQVG